MFTRTGQGAIGYVLMGYPRMSETFIASEVHRVERAGVRVRLFVLKPVEEKERGLRHPVNDAIAAEPQYMPDTASLTAPLHRWRPRHLKPFLPALRRVARRRPRGLARAFATAGRQALRDRRTRLSGPRKVYIKEFLQAIALADRLLEQPEVRHLHAHFAHGTTTVDLARRDDRRPAVLVHRPRARHLRAGAEPARLAAPQAARRAVHGHLHGGQRGAPEGDRTRGRRPPRLPRPERRLRAHGARGRAERRGAQRPAARARRRPPGGQEGLRRPGRGVRGAGAPRGAVRGADRRPGRQARRRGARADRGARPRRPRRAAGPDGPGRPAARVPPRRRAVHAVPPAPERPRRDPQRARRGDGGGRAGGRQRRVRHPRADQPRGQRAAGRARRPGGARRRPDPPPRDRELAARVTAAGRRTVEERFDGDLLARRLAGLFERAAAR